MHNVEFRARGALLNRPRYFHGRVNEGGTRSPTALLIKRGFAAIFSIELGELDPPFSRDKRDAT
jgi:hypothetical protein